MLPFDSIPTLASFTLSPSYCRDYVVSEQRLTARTAPRPESLTPFWSGLWMVTSLLPVLVACSGGATAVTGPDDGSPRDIEAVIVRPSEMTLQVGDTAHLEVRGRNGKGNEVSLSARDVTWASSDPETASVDETGFVEALEGGRVNISATFKPGKSGRSMRDSAKIIAEERSGGGDGGGRTTNTRDPFRAFPEAEGWGAEALTQCDRSDVQVLAVTNLRDFGAGSLRDAISRVRSDILSIVTFHVAGYINISEAIRITSSASCLYIAGQTAPGEGVTLRAWDGSAIVFRNGPVSDVVIRYLRFRNGTKRPGSNTNAQGMIVGAGTGIVLDHLSFSWANDQLLSIYKYPHDWGPLRSLTLQRSLLVEPLASSPVCYSTKGDTEGESDGVPDWYEVENVTMHHNAALHCGHRAPMISSKNAEVINNVVYNWNIGAMHTSRKAYVDYIGNFFKRGPMNRDVDIDFAYEFSHDFRTNTTYDREPDGYRIIGNTNNIDGRTGPTLYLSGNAGPHNSAGTTRQWSMTSKYKNNETGGLPESYYSSTRYADVGKMPISVDGVRLTRDSRLSAAPIPVTVESASQTWQTLIEDGGVGANRHLTCAGDWVEMADAVDERVLSEARNGTGRGSALQIESQSDVGGFPKLDPGSTCPDSDEDGIPDQFEAGFRLDPRDPGDASADADGDGYTNLEEYVNGTVPRRQ